MAQKVKIDGLAEAVMKELTEYADLATVDMKAAVKKAGNQADGTGLYRPDSI